MKLKLEDRMEEKILSIEIRKSTKKEKGEPIKQIL